MSSTEQKFIKSGGLEKYHIVNLDFESIFTKCHKFESNVLS